MVSVLIFCINISLLISAISRMFTYDDAHDKTTVILSTTSQLKGKFDEAHVLGCDGKTPILFERMVL